MQVFVILVIIATEKHTLVCYAVPLTVNGALNVGQGTGSMCVLVEQVKDNYYLVYEEVLYW